MQGNQFSPGSENVIDESMGKWIPFFDNTLLIKGIPKLSKIISKPEGVGVEYKVRSDENTGIKLHIKIQESEDMTNKANKDVTDRYAKHTALVQMLTNMLHGKGHIVYGGIQHLHLLKLCRNMACTTLACKKLHIEAFSRLTSILWHGLAKNIVGGSLLKQLQLEGGNTGYTCMDMPGMNQEKQMYLGSVS